MVKGWDYMRGMPPGGTLIINTHYTPEYMIRFVPGAERWHSSYALTRRSWPTTNGSITGWASSDWTAFRQKRGRAKQAGRSGYCCSVNCSSSENDKHRQDATIEPMIANKKAFNWR